MQVVVVEANGDPAHPVSALLRDSGYGTDVAHDEQQMLQLVQDQSPAAVILDAGVFRNEHLRVIRDFRSRDASTPLVLITPLGKEDGIRCLEAGADDYLTRPVSRRELLARLRALFRRCGCEGPDLLRVETLEIDRRKRAVTRDKQWIDLTNREYALLEALMLASPEPVSRSALLQRIWQGQLSQQTNVVNVIINRLRNKISLPGTTPLLHTVWGIGYALRTKNP